MNRTVLLCAASIMACSVQARNLKQPTPIADTYIAAIHNSLLSKQLNTTTGAKTTAVQYRYIASSYRVDNQLRDTGHYYYSGFRGSKHPTSFDYTDMFEVTVMGSEQRLQTDSSIGWQVAPNGTKTKHTHKAYQYDANNRPTLVKSGIYNYLEYAVSYTGNGNFQNIIQRDTMGGSQLSDKFKHYYTYNSQNKVVLDSLVSTIINTGVAKATFTYDANGNMLTIDRYSTVNSVWEQTSHMEYTYDSDNRMLGSEYSYYSNGTPVPGSKYTYAYTGTAKQFTYQEYAYWDNVANAWEPGESFTYTLTPTGFIDTFYIREYNSFGGWDTVERDHYTYHSDNRLSKLNGYLYQGGGMFDTDPYDEQKFYYEEYYPASVNNIASAASSVTLYPNPASSKITIEAKGAASFAILNMNGQTVQHGKLDATANIDISSLTTGIYNVTIIGAAGEKIGNKNFMKQ